MNLHLLSLAFLCWVSVSPVLSGSNTCTDITKSFRASSDHPACRCFTTGMRADDSGDTTWIGCTQKDLLDLHSSLDSLAPATAVSKLWMWDCSLPVLIPALFNKVRPVTLKIEMSTTRKWAPGVFDQLGDRLKHLELKHNQILELNKASFAQLKTLERLDLSGNNVSKLTVDSIGVLPELTELFLQKNEIKTIADDTFSGLSNLKHLNLAHNKLSKITVGTFRGLTNLETLTINDNQILEIERDAFSHMTKLRSLNLGKNNLTELHLGDMPELKELLLYRNHFKSLRQLRPNQPLRSLNLLSLDRNRIQSVDELDLVHMPALNSLLLAFNNISRVYENALHPVKNLRTLSLQNNRLTSLHDGLFLPVMMLEHLLLSDNQLQQITERTLYGLRHLKVLVLTKNNISVFHRRALAAMFSLERLYINQNQLSSMDNGTLMYIDGSVRSIDLSDNPWNCNCALSWLPSWLERHSRIAVNIDLTTCHKTTVRLSKPSHTTLPTLVSAERELRNECSESGEDGDNSFLDDLSDSGHATWITAIAIVLAVVSLLILAAIAVLYMQELRRGLYGVGMQYSIMSKPPSDREHLIKLPAGDGQSNNTLSTADWDKPNTKSALTTSTVTNELKSADSVADSQPTVHEKKEKKMVRFQTPSQTNLSSLRT